MVFYTGDTGPCGTGSAGPGRWEGRVTSREGGPRRGRWLEAPFLPRAGSSNCGGTLGPRKRTTSRGQGSTAAGAQNGLVSGRRVLARDPGPSAPGAQPPPLPPPALRPEALSPPAACSRSPSGPCCRGFRLLCLGQPCPIRCFSVPRLRAGDWMLFPPCVSRPLAPFF